jgi:hypothetical protein
MTTPHRGKKPKWQTHPHSKSKCEQSKASGHGERLPDNVVDGVVAVFKRKAKITVCQVTQEAEVLFPTGLIEMVFGEQGAFDLRRSRPSFAIEWSAGCDPDEGKCKDADEKQQRQGEGETLKEVHVRATTFLAIED